jgi:hypothetical protein
MDNQLKRRFLFLLGCIPTRLFLAYLINKSILDKNLVLQKIITVILASISIGFAIIYIFKLRETGPEVFGDKIWWNHLRPIHSFMYGLAAYLLYNNNNGSSLIIVMDTFIGLSAYLMK